MAYKFKISKYSTWDDYTYTNKGNNYSSIATKMVQLAGRLCERFAGDIVYDINSYSEAIKDGESFDKILFFREMGVTTFPKEYIERIKGTDYIQSWRLTYNPETEEQEFVRVYVIEEWNFNEN